MRDQVKYQKNHACYVLDNHNDFHKQITCIKNDLLCLQAQKQGIKWTFVIDGKTITKEFRLFFPVLFYWRYYGTQQVMFSSWKGVKLNFPADYVGQPR